MSDVTGNKQTVMIDERFLFRIDDEFPFRVTIATPDGKHMEEFTRDLGGEWELVCKAKNHFPFAAEPEWSDWYSVFAPHKKEVVVFHLDNALRMLQFGSPRLSVFLENAHFAIRHIKTGELIPAEIFE